MNRLRTLAALSAAIIAVGALAWLKAAPGDLDPTFGNGGIVTTDVTGCCESASDVAVQPDGKIIVAGTVLTSFQTFNDSDFMLARYDSTGALDGTFGTGGVVITGFASPSSDAALQLALQPDGKIVVAGWSWAGAGQPTEFAIARYLADGRLDSTFDDDGKQTFGFGTPSAKASSLAIQPDGRIVVAGFVSDDNGINDFAVARLTADGTLDPTFGTLGRVRTPVSTELPSTFLDDDYAYAVAIHPDGGIVVAGEANAADGRGRAAIVRYLTDGTLDTNFSGDGKLTFTFYDYSDQIYALAIQPDGRIVAAGQTRNPNGALVIEFGVVRLDASGTFDPTFDGDGKATTRFQPTATGGSQDSAGRDVVIQPDGRIVVAGGQGNDFALARYQAGGALDTSFSGDGRVVISLELAGYESAMAVALQSDGKILTAGGLIPPNGSGQLAKILVTRFDGGGGSLDQTIDFAPLLDRTFGDPPFDVSATASSGLPVRFTATGACAVNGATVSLTTTGICSITASQDGDTTYASAPDVTQAFDVLGARTLTVSRSGTGGGRVTSSPFGVDCGVDCVGTFQDGVVVTLTAQADSGSFFAGWSGDADCSDGQVTMNVDVSCTAAFTSQRYIAELAAEIRSGTSGSAPGDMAVFNGSLYFSANDGTNGRELWRLDANAPAPVMVADVAPGPGSSSPGGLTVAGGVLYFTATTSATGFELFRYDGVSATLAADINPGVDGSQVRSLTAFGDQIVFIAFDGADGDELFAYDPAVGLIPFNIDNSCPECGSFPYGLLVHEGRLYFGASEPVFGDELYSYDGVTVARLTDGLSPTSFVGIPGRLIYSAGLQVTQLRSYELATGDDVEIVLPNVNFFGPVARQFVRMNGVAYFTAQDDVNGRELWVTDGTAPNTRLVADVFPGPTGSNPSNLTPFNGELVFAASDPVWGFELRATSGSGSRLIADLAPGTNNAGFGGLMVASNLLFFESQGGGTTLQPWVSDGTAAGTEMLREADGTAINQTGDSTDDTSFTQFNGTVYFAAANSGVNFELWKVSTGGSANQPPIAVATAPGTVQAGATCVANVVLDGSGSSDPDGDTLTYTWSENGTTIATGVNPTVVLSIGTHVITMRVDDGQGASSVDDVTVIVENAFQVAYVGPAVLQGGSSNVIQVAVTNGAAPVANAAVAISVNGTTLQATTDAAGIASVAAGPLPGTSTTVRIDYVSACGAVTKTVTVPVNAWPTITPSASSPVFAGANCAASVLLTPNASDLNGDSLTYVWSEGGVTLSAQANPTVSLAVGLHTIDLTVSDGQGGSASSSVVIDVKKALMGLSFVLPLPQFTVGMPVSVSARLTVGTSDPISGASLAFSLSGSSASGTTDANGVATVSLTPGNNGIQELSVSYAGDACREAVTFKTNVTVERATATVTVRKVVVNDDGGQLTAGAFSISVASPSDLKTIAGSATAVPVTVNVGAYTVTETPTPDYDVSYSPECNGTTVAGETKTCVVTNDDKPATLTLIKNVTNDNGGSLQPGAWTLRANGQAFVQNTATEVQPGAFTLTEDGPAGYSASAWSCSVTVTNGTITVPAHRAVSCTITNDDSPGTLNVVVQVTTNSGGPPADPSKVTVTVNGGSPTPASFAGSAAGTAVTLNAGGYTVATTPLAGYTATPSADCAGTMTLGGSKTCTVVFDDDAPQQRPPVADDQSPATNEDTALQIQLTANDPDGDPLSFIIVGGPANGQLTGTGAARVYTPNADFNGVDSFTFKVNDGLADSNTATVSITVQSVNDTPTATPQTLTTSANTPVGATLTGSDVETATLTFAIATQPTNGTVQLNGASMIYTPATNYTGPDSFTFTASDGAATSAPATVSIDVSPAPNTPPVADAKFVETLTATPVGVTLSGSDADNDPLSFAIAAPPSNGILDGSVPNLTYTPNAGFSGTDTFTYKANDGKVDSAPATVTVNVRAINAELSVVLVDTPDPVKIGQTLTYLARVFNNSSEIVPNPTLTFTLPAGVSYTPVGPCTAVGNIVTCRPPAFNIGENPFSINVVPQVAGSISASVYTPDLNNPDEPQNTGTATTLVERVDSTTTLSSSLNPSTYGQTVTFTATVTGNNPSGSVTFTSDLGVIGTVSLNDGVATIATAALQTGQRVITASYAGDATNAPGSSAPLGQTVQPFPTTTTLASSANPSFVGQPVTFTATVSGAIPTGTVTFTIDGMAQSPVGLGGNSTATLQTSGLGEGSHTVTASYSGDANNTPSPSNTVTQVVQRITTSTTLISSPNPSTAGQAVTFTATVSGGTPTGVVTFQISGGAQLGQATVVNGVATLTSALGAGTFSVTAAYGGDPAHTPSTSSAVSQQVGKTATSVSLAIQPNPAAPGTTVALIATVTGFSPSGSVTFLEGNTVLGTGVITDGTATLVIPQGKKGSRQISASYPGDANNLASTSPRVRLTTK